MLLNEVLDNKDKKLPYKIKGDNVDVKNLNSTLIAYLGTLEPEFQDMVTITSGNDSEHTENSRHYKNRAMDISFDPRLYKRVSQDPLRKKMGLTLLDPDHGTAKHMHFSVGEGTESDNDVWRDGPKKDNRVKAYQILLNKGYDRNTALGIVGNLVQESGPSLDTEVLGFDGTGSYGIAQWLGKRKERLKKISPDNFNTIEGQIDFLDWELNNTHKSAYEKIKAESTMEGKTTAFSDYYEIPNKAFAYNDKRIKYAQEVAAMIPESQDNGKLLSTKETQINNTSDYLNSQNSPTYASMGEEEESKKPEVSSNEANLMELVEQYKAQAEKSKVELYQKMQQPQTAPEEEQYEPQQMQNTDQLYNYIDIETYEDGGQKTYGCGGKGQPPCNEDYYKTIRNSRQGVKVNPDGSKSTHLMGDNGVDTAFPTLFQNTDGSWEDLSKNHDAAYKRAVKAGEIYKFKNEQDLIDFARKGSWKGNKFEDGGQKTYGCGGKGQPPCEKPKNSDENFNNASALYDPIYEKLINAYNVKDYGELMSNKEIHPYVRQGLNKAFGYSFDDFEEGKRIVPPMNEKLYKLQKTILNTPDAELKELLKKDYRDVGVFNMGSFLPDEVGIFEALGYANEFNKLKKEGYTFEDGGKKKLPTVAEDLDNLHVKI